MRAKLDACQTHAAGNLAARERHGDGGAGVLTKAAGLSRREAVGQVKTAQRLQALPDVQRAVERGQVSFNNARVLADASDKTSPGAVTEDAELLMKASSLPPDQFAKEAGRWAAQRQDDGGEAAWKRLRPRRRLSIWDGDDGMVHLRGEFDPVAGAKLRKRLNEQAETLRRQDLRLPEDDRRSRHQRMADALEILTAGGTEGGSGRRADIAIVQHLSADGTRDFAEIAGGAVIPQSVLDEHMCNSRITGIVFSVKGRAAVAWPHQDHRYRGPVQGSHRQVRRMRGLRRAAAAVPGPSHQARVGGRSHRHHQHDPVVLALPPEGPPPRLEGGSRWTGPSDDRAA